MFEVSKNLVIIGTVFDPKRRRTVLLAKEKMEFLILTWLRNEHLKRRVGRGIHKFALT